MSAYYETQPDDNDPIEMTHFDMWFPNEDDEPDIDAYERAGTKALAKELDKVLKAWDKTLGTNLENIALHVSKYKIDVVYTLGMDMIWDLVIMRLLGHGYNVFQGESFIEVYVNDD